MMDELQEPVVILVNKSIADEGMRKGIVEIAQRREDAKFSAITKCKLLEKGINFQQAESIASFAAAQNAPSTSDMIKVVRNLMKAVRKNGSRKNSRIAVSDAQIKHISTQVDNIFRTEQAVLSLSYLNTGLLLANTAVDAAGFAIINEKIDALDAKVDQMAMHISKIEKVQKNEKTGDFQGYIVKYQSMVSDMQDGDEIDTHRIEDLLQEMYRFISEMLWDLFDEALEKDHILNMVFTLLPAYTVLMEKYTQEYYFKKHKLPANYRTYMQVYDIIQQEKTVSNLGDYYFLKQKKSSIETLDIINAQTLLMLNEKTQIEDTVELLQALETKDNFEKFDHALEDLAEKNASAFVADQENKQKEIVAKLSEEKTKQAEDSIAVSPQPHAKYDIPIE